MGRVRYLAPTDSGVYGASALTLLALSDTDHQSFLTTTLDSYVLPDFNQATRFFGQFANYDTLNGYHDGRCR